jgi:serine/threonine protein phosphatase 1
LLFPKRLKLFHEIYIGHTPTLYYDTDIPMQGCNVWNLDTGAAFKDKLTVMDIDTNKFWQSDPVISLYPGQLGRNRDDKIAEEKEYSPDSKRL